MHNDVPVNWGISLSSSATVSFLRMTRLLAFLSFSFSNNSIFKHIYPVSFTVIREPIFPFISGTAYVFFFFSGLWCIAKLGYLSVCIIFTFFQLSFNYSLKFLTYLTYYLFKNWYSCQSVLKSLLYRTSISTQLTKTFLLI